MSKLKTAKTIRASMQVMGVILGWGALGLFGLWAIILLVMWASAHFVSFIWIMGIIAVIAGTRGMFWLWDWSSATIKKAEEEEFTAQERERGEKDAQEAEQWYKWDSDRKANHET